MKPFARVPRVSSSTGYPARACSCGETRSSRLAVSMSAFLYWEDADLCRRLRNRGFHVRYVPGATAVHHVGQSSQDRQAVVDQGVSRER